MSDDIKALKQVREGLERSIASFDKLRAEKVSQLEAVNRAIAALSEAPTPPAPTTVSKSKGEGMLLDDVSRETSPVQSAPDQDKAWQSDGLGQLTAHPWSLASAFRDGYEGRKRITPHHPEYTREYNLGAAAKEKATFQPQQPAPPIPEGFTKWEGGECPVGENDVVEVLFAPSTGLEPVTQPAYECNWSGEVEEGGWQPIIAYRPILWTQEDLDAIDARAKALSGAIVFKASANAERIEDASQGTQAIEQTEHDQPKLTDQQYESLEPLPADKPSTVFLDQAEAAINDRIEDEPPTNPVADDFAKGLLMESQAKAEHKRFGIFGIEFGGKKTLVGEGV